MFSLEAGSGPIEGDNDAPRRSLDALSQKFSCGSVRRALQLGPKSFARRFPKLRDLIEHSLARDRRAICQLTQNAAFARIDQAAQLTPGQELIE